MVPNLVVKSSTNPRPKPPGIFFVKNFSLTLHTHLGMALSPIFKGVIYVE
jgi:hypothetical protein